MAHTAPSGYKQRRALAETAAGLLTLAIREQQRQPHTRRACGRDRSQFIPELITLQRAMNDMIEPIDRHELIDNSDPADAIEPIERIEPTEPTDRTEPLEPIDSTESSDHNDHLELSEARRTDQNAKATRLRRARRRSVFAFLTRPDASDRREEKPRSSVAVPTNDVVCWQVAIPKSVRTVRLLTPPSAADIASALEVLSRIDGWIDQAYFRTLAHR